MFYLWQKRPLDEGMFLLLEEKEMCVFHSLIVNSCIVVDSTNSWWIDFKATKHICNSLQEFQLRTRLNGKEIYLTLASAVRTIMQVMVDITIVLENNKQLEDIILLCLTSVS